MNKPLAVMKFGGTSVVPPNAVRASIECVRACVERGEQPIVVVSAPAGVTDLLKTFADHPWTRVSSELIEETARRFVETFAGYRECLPSGALPHQYFFHTLPTLIPEEEGAKYIVWCHGEGPPEYRSPSWSMNPPMECLYEWIRAHLTYGSTSLLRGDERTAFLLSLGEHASAPLFAFAMSEAGLPARALHASRFLYTTETPALEASPLADQRDLGYRIQDYLQNDYSDSPTIPVITGFVGCAGSKITLLGRGGSDYTASIVAEAIRASRVEIWTDVDGVFTADPRIATRGARVIPRIGYKTATEFAGFGAKVIHPKTILPAIRAGIPVHVRNTFNTDAPGTIIVPDDQVTDEERSRVKGIAVRKNMRRFFLRSPTMVGAVGYLNSALLLFEKHRFDIDFLSSSEATITLAAAGGDEDLSAFMAELGKIVRAEYKGMVAVVTYVHEDQKILEEQTQSLSDLARSGIAVRGATFGEEGHFQLLVDPDRADETVRILHSYLIKSPYN